MVMEMVVSGSMVSNNIRVLDSFDQSICKAESIFWRFDQQYTPIYELGSNVPLNIETNIGPIYGKLKFTNSNLGTFLMLVPDTFCIDAKSEDNKKRLVFYVCEISKVIGNDVYFITPKWDIL